ncbi:MAG: L,D-transpeptidase [Pseudomonadota bacterium]
MRVTNTLWKKRCVASFGLPALFVTFLCLLTSPSLAAILINIDKPSQTMTVTVNGEPRYSWPVSTGATGYSTPTGNYSAFRMERMHYSVEWDGAGMPHSIFFTTRGHAIHGSNHPGMGTPRSHGCVRLSLGNAERLFNLVEQHGMAGTKVVVSGADPAGRWAASSAPPAVRTLGSNDASPYAETRERRGPFRGLFRRRQR